MKTEVQLISLSIIGCLAPLLMVYVFGIKENPVFPALSAAYACLFGHVNHLAYRQWATPKNATWLILPAIFLGLLICAIALYFRQYLK